MEYFILIAIMMLLFLQIAIFLKIQTIEEDKISKKEMKEMESRIVNTVLHETNLLVYEIEKETHDNEERNH